MNFSFDKLLAAFGKNQAINDTTEAILNDIEDTPFAISTQNVMYAAAKELGGYYYFKTIVVGTFKIKTIKGAELNIVGDDFKLALTTDMDEFESESSNVSNRYITQIDFQIEQEDVSKINSDKIKSLVLVAKKHMIDFNTVKN